MSLSEKLRAELLEANRDHCPTCGGVREQLVVAAGRFYCPKCGVAGPHE